MSHKYIQVPVKKKRTLRKDKILGRSLFKCREGISYQCPASKASQLHVDGASDEINEVSAVLMIALPKTDIQALRSKMLLFTVV